MQSPITVYKEVLAEFDVDEKLDVTPIAKATYLHEQVGQQKAILNRLFFDATTAKLNMERSKDDVAKDAHRKKLDDYRNDVRQILTALKINLELIEALEEEYPELKPEA